jgi:hypothetical protein
LFPRSRFASRLPKLPRYPNFWRQFVLGL